MEIFLVNDKVPRNGTACLIEKFLVQEAQYQARHIVGCRRNFSQKIRIKNDAFHQQVFRLASLVHVIIQT
jgi:hypothetical protein